MKKLYVPIACLLAVSFLISCSSEEEETVESVSLPTQATPTTQSPLKSTDTFKPVFTNATPGTTALNPAHGQPGHRCEIAVGAPLNSAPATATIPPVQMQRPTQLSAPMQANPNNAGISAKPAVVNQPAVVATGMNPAHGQPGHRCDISVGAPLNSAPTQNTPVQMQSPIQAPAPLVVNPNNTGTGGAKLNPAHGQPGHDCAVAVGKPLKQ